MAIGAAGAGAVVYEAGPTGYGLARACAQVGMSCVVAAPSRIRAAADRVKTDGETPSGWRGCFGSVEITAYAIPGRRRVARDLVRAREDARGDLPARHRLSKLLLRHGAVLRGTSVDAAHDGSASSAAVPECGRSRSCSTSATAACSTRRAEDALDEAISELAASEPYVDVVERLVCLRGVSTLTAFALTVGSATGTAFVPPRSAPSLGSLRVRTRAENDAGKAASPRPATATCAGC